VAVFTTALQLTMFEMGWKGSRLNGLGQGWQNESENRESDAYWNEQFVTFKEEPVNSQARATRCDK